MMLSFPAILLTYASTSHGKLSRNVDDRLFGSGWTRYTTRVKEHSPCPRKSSQDHDHVCRGLRIWTVRHCPDCHRYHCHQGDSDVEERPYIYKLIARHQPPIHSRIWQQWPSPATERISHYGWNGTLNSFSPNDINANLRQSTIMSSVRICIR